MQAADHVIYLDPAGMAEAAGHALKRWRRAQEDIQRCREELELLCGRAEDLLSPESEALRHVRDALQEVSGGGARMATDRGASLVREGDFWTVRYDGVVVRVRHVLGIDYLRKLLERPGDELHVTDVAGLPRQVGALASPLLDEQAKRAYRRRLRELQADADDASEPGGAFRARLELESIAHELARATGIGGRDRTASDGVERARVNVTRALRSAIGRLSDLHPALGHHLRTSVRTGFYCSYDPDPATAPRWRL